MTLAQLEKFRDDVKAQYAAHAAMQPGPGQEVQKHLAGIELQAALRTMEQVIAIERMEMSKPQGAIGPVLVGV